MLGRRSFLGVVGALALGSLALFACNKPAPGGSGGAAKGVDDAGEIKVGAFLSLSGGQSTFGIDTREGIELAVEQTNAAGGIKGRKVRVLYEDDKSNAQEASNKVKQLIDRDKVVAILGEVASSRSLAGGLVANNSKIPMITPSSTNVEVTQGREWVFRACFTDDMQGQQAAHYAVETLKKTKIAIFYVAQDSYSSGLAAAFRAEAKKLGASLVVDKGYQKDETNFTTYLNEIKAAAPEIVFVPNYYTDMVPIARQAKAIGMPGSLFLGGDGWDSEDLLKGASAELEGAHFTNHYAPDVPWPNAQAFFKAYRDKYHRDPTSLSAQGYDAAGLLFDAMKRAGTVAADAVRGAIASTKGFSGATGTLTIDANRNAQKPLVVVEVKGGAFKYATTAGGAAAP